ncbi:dihydropyrimidinase [Candidatus Hecatella orcuttiae]|jgi:dihydropyrimidinase|uniref:dihydropyrimidinase n=1 Tax=Candidatus Hecatella orcuttiae TaxID=1935119 RepID=UPI002867CAF8|nr:dihydropyrimidinase [Candidatus Hecatella orcuttiae]
MKVDLIIDGGTVVTAAGVMKVAIAVEAGKISALGSRSVLPKAEKVIQAEGKIVIPGGIDPHVHYELYQKGETSPETWDKGTIAAAMGGTTMVIDFATQQKGKPLTEAVKQKLSRAAELSAVDYSVHGTLTDFTDLDKMRAEMKEMIDRGIPSFKEYMCYREEGWYADDWALLAVFKAAQEYGGLVKVHAENVSLIENWQQECLRKGWVEAKYHGVAKPNFVEAEAIQRALSLAEFAGSKVYIAHVSTREGVELVGNTRGKGLPAYAETCPHYLTLTEDLLEAPDGFYYICSPPLRKREDVEELWRGLADGRISVVSSDHAVFTSEQKSKHSAVFTEVPNGFPGVEIRVPIVYSEGVEKRRLSLSRFVELVSANAAKVYGVYPRKGVLAPGSDADIVIIDPKKEKTLDCDSLHMGADWSAYEGWKVTGWPTTTILRGKIIVDGEDYVGTPGEGEFVERKIEDAFIKTV